MAPVTTELPRLRLVTPTATDGRHPEPVVPSWRATPTALVPRSRTERRRPVHLAIMAGLAAGAYAISLAGVTALQASTDRAISDATIPTSDAVDLLKTHHDDLEARLAAAAAAYDAAAARYHGIAGDLLTYEKQLKALAQKVTEAKGSATWVPASGASLPSVGRSAAAAPRPASHATTCASGKPCP